jgi:hypothetical protein
MGFNIRLDIIKSDPNKAGRRVFHSYKLTSLTGSHCSVLNPVCSGVDFS